MQFPYSELVPINRNMDYNISTIDFEYNDLLTEKEEIYAI